MMSLHKFPILTVYKTSLHRSKLEIDFALITFYAAGILLPFMFYSIEAFHFYLTSKVFSINTFLELKLAKNIISPNSCNRLIATGNFIYIKVQNCKEIILGFAISEHWGKRFRRKVLCISFIKLVENILIKEHFKVLLCLHW